MSNEVIVHKGRTNIIIIDMGIDVSGDVFTSEIRSEPNQEATLLATWQVVFESDGSDGRFILTLDDFITSEIRATSGYMDLKRVTGGEPIPVFDTPLKVSFRGTVTQ